MWMAGESSTMKGGRPAGIQQDMNSWPTGRRHTLMEVLVSTWSHTPTWAMLPEKNLKQRRGHGTSSEGG